MRGACGRTAAQRWTEGAVSNGHGGYRPGGGRPREGVQFSIRLPEEWVADLDRIAELEGFRRADAVRMVVNSGLRRVLRLSESLAKAREHSGLDEDEAMELAVEETRAARRERGDR